MLRLCHGLDRFSVDLDFWLASPNTKEKVFADLHSYLSNAYLLKDAADKFYSLVFDLKSPLYPRSLKIEIRKGPKKAQTEQAIAYSPHSTRQVLVRVITLREMMASKTAAFLDRGEIRDVYDMEFLHKRGIELVPDKKVLEKLLKKIELFSPIDYSVKLGSLLEPDKRAYYREQNFRILKAAIQDTIRRLT